MRKLIDDYSSPRVKMLYFAKFQRLKWLAKTSSPITSVATNAHLLKTSTAPRRDISVSIRLIVSRKRSWTICFTRERLLCAIPAEMRRRYTARCRGSVVLKRVLMLECPILLQKSDLWLDGCLLPRQYRRCRALKDWIALLDLLHITKKVLRLTKSWRLLLPGATLTYL